MSVSKSGTSDKETHREYDKVVRRWQEKGLRARARDILHPPIDISLTRGAPPSKLCTGDRGCVEWGPTSA